MTDTPSPTQANKALVADFYELMNARRFDEMWDLFTDDATWSNGGSPPSTTNPIEVMRGIIVDPMPIFVTGGMDFTVHSMTAEEDRVAAEVSCRAELTTGKVYANQYHMLFRCRGSKITEVKEYNDTLHAHRVFGDLR